MKRINLLLLIAFCFPGIRGFSQSVSINEDNSPPNPNAILDVKSFNKGILIPRISTAARLAIPTIAGLLVYDTTTATFWYSEGKTWLNLYAPLLRADSGWLQTGKNNPDIQSTLGTTDSSALVFKVNDRPSGLLDPSNSNTFLGYNSGVFTRRDTAHDNTGVGAYALYSNVAGSYNTAGGAYALYNNTASFNTAMGGLALYSNTVGVHNTALGDSAMRLNISGSFNTATGQAALHSNKTGDRNVATGYHALFTNDFGTDNTASGAYALASNTSGTSNTASGVYALFSNNTGIGNTATGAFALYSNTTGVTSVAKGSHALYSNTTGGSSVAIGARALYSNTNGDYNVAAGDSAAYNSREDFNVALGHRALFNNTTGSKNTAVGAGADVASSGLTNTTAIGAGAIVDASNKVRIGNSAVTIIEGQVPFTIPSDGRFKYKVQEDVKGLSFILQLRPVTYRFDVRRFDEALSSVDHTIPQAMEAAYTAAAAIRRSGFIAQEVERAANTAGYDFSGVVRPVTDKDHYSLSYESFVVPLVKGMQEQQQTLGAQQERLESIQSSLDKNEQPTQQLSVMRLQMDQLLKKARKMVNKKLSTPTL